MLFRSVEPSVPGMDAVPASRVVVRGRTERQDGPADLGWQRESRTVAGGGEGRGIRFQAGVGTRPDPGIQLVLHRLLGSGGAAKPDLYIGPGGSGIGRFRDNRSDGRASGRGFFGNGAAPGRIFSQQRESRLFAETV